MEQTATYSLWQMIRYFLQLGAVGFGGPVALVGYMHRDLVEKKQWISEEDFKEGLALAQLAPGPLAAQLAIYMGYVHYRIWGATLVGFAFVLPSFLMVLGLGAVYTLYSGLSWLQAVFYGVGATVIGIIAFSAYKLTNKSIGKDYWLWGIYLLSAAVTIITETENVLMFLGAGAVYWAVKSRKLQGLPHVAKTFSWPLLAAAGSFFTVKQPATLVQIMLFFGKAGAFVFGSGLAIVPFLYGGVVKEHQWLSEQQFLDAVAVAMITPGPVVITVGFIGFLVEGFWGATVAAFATFLPCYLFTILPAPYFKKYGKNPHIKLFVDGITAAAIGAIAGAVVVLGRRTIDDLPALALAALTVFLLYRFKKLQEPYLILGGALIGLLWNSLM